MCSCFWGQLQGFKIKNKLSFTYNAEASFPFFRVSSNKGHEWAVWNREQQNLNASYTLDSHNQNPNKGLNFD
jgi:spore germination protein YaaH